VNDMEGGGRGDSYIALAKFLLDCRGRNGGGLRPDQSPVQQQYEAVGHAVRASYLFSGMADVAAETHDVDYQSAVMSLWDNLINKKYYVTGGIGSGETSEGFGPENYSLRNEAYCEACSSCGEIFFQWKMNLAYHDAKYADLYEETIYNALLGATDLDGKNFYYDNPLVEDKPRYPWHVCPCCVGNIPRTLLMIPTWTYTKATTASTSIFSSAAPSMSSASPARTSRWCRKRIIRGAATSPSRSIRRRKNSPCSCACRTARPANFTRRRRRSAVSNRSR
jgi:DUF1680 family protein